jgi:hypothetical protein
MATKQTLKSLLGGSDERKQVSLDLGTPALRPTVQRAGQYNVAVQATPKTNSAMQLAQALRVAPQVLGQANNIAMDMGAKAAATTMDVEGALDDTERKGILGYDKAYQQGLIKRHFVMNEQAITERFMNLSRTDDSLQMTTDQFVERIEGERQEFVDELVGQFGTNSNRVDAIAALTGSFVDNLRDESMGAWVDNKKDQAFMQLSADTSDITKKKGVTAGLDHARAEMNAWALDLKSSEKAAKLRGIVTADIDVAVAEGRFRDASRLFAEAEKYKIVGNATLFGSVEGKKEKAKILARIESGLSKTSREDQDDLEDEYAAIVGDAYGGLRGVETEEDISPAQRTQMLNSFQMLRPEADDATISEMFDKVFSGSGDPLQNYSSLLRETAVNGTDASADLYNGSRNKLDYILNNYANRPLSPIALTAKRKKRAIEEFTAWYQNNPEKDYRDWVSETSQPFKKFTELTTLSNELSKGGFVRGTLEFKNLSTDLNKLASKLGDTLEVEFNGSILTTIQSSIEKELVSYGQTVADDPKSLELVAKKRESLFTDVQERLKGLAVAQNMTIDELSEVRKNEINQAGAKGGMGRNAVRYNSLKLGNRAAQLAPKDWSMITSERSEMLSNKHLPQLQLSLTRHGFTSYSPSNTKFLTESGLDSGDVSLVGNDLELNDIAARFGAVIEADIGLNTLTDDQKKIRAEYQALGIYDRNTLAQFARLQISLLK